MATQILPNLILLDLMMPIKDGFEFRVEQLSNRRFAAIPVVVVTADGYSSERKDKLQAKAIVKKPVDIGRLVEVGRQHCA